MYITWTRFSVGTGELLGVTLLDFVIVTDPIGGFKYHSFRESGVLS